MSCNAGSTGQECHALAADLTARQQLLWIVALQRLLGTPSVHDLLLLGRVLRAYIHQGIVGHVGCGNLLDEAVRIILLVDYRQVLSHMLARSVEVSLLFHEHVASHDRCHVVRLTGLEMHRLLRRQSHPLKEL